MPAEPWSTAQPPPHSGSSEPNWKMNRAAQLFSASERSSNCSMRNPAATTSAHSASRVAIRPAPPPVAAIDVAQRQPSAAPQLAEPLGERPLAISGQRQAAFRQHAVEAVVGEGQPGGVGDDKRRRFAARAAVGRDDEIDADRRDAAVKQQPRRRAQPAADVGDRLAGAETGAIDQLSRQRQTAGAQRLAGAVAQRPAAEHPFSRWRRAQHHLSSSACSTFSMRPRASSSET